MFSNRYTNCVKAVKALISPS